MDDFLTEEGELDPEAITEAVNDLLVTRPGLAKNPKVAAVDPTQGQGGPVGRKVPTWNDLLT